MPVIMLDAMEEANTSKLQPLPLGSWYWKETEKKILYNTRKNWQQLVAEHITSGQKLWGQASRKTEGSELGLEEWIDVNMQK